MMAKKRNWQRKKKPRHGGGGGGGGGVAMAVMEEVRVEFDALPADLSADEIDGGGRVPGGVVAWRSTSGLMTQR